MAKSNRTNRQLEEIYESGQYRVSQERNDFLIPQVVDFVKEKMWINIRPEYQRRLVWDKSKKSRFIESLLMNIPVPPIFLFECELNRYEVMDGQQRINSILEFYDNSLPLTGLEKWDDLNGRTYKECPPIIQRGFDRRRIAAVVLLAESKSFGAGKEDIRKLVFQRLNTGGLTLKPQELRNCLYSGPFNELLIELAGNRLFDEIWGIPAYEDHITHGHVSRTLAENTLYMRMTDCEIVLRFFAFRESERIKGSVQSILDSCMERNRNLDQKQRKEWHNRFIDILKLSREIFGKNVFKISEEETKKKPSQSLYDAVMVSLDRLYDHRNKLIKKKARLCEAMNQKLREEIFYALIVGRPNTAKAVKQRLDQTERLFRNVIGL